MTTEVRDPYGLREIVDKHAQLTREMIARDRQAQQREEEAREIGAEMLTGALSGLDGIDFLRYQTAFDVDHFTVSFLRNVVPGPNVHVDLGNGYSYAWVARLDTDTPSENPIAWDVYKQDREQGTWLPASRHFTSLPDIVREVAAELGRRHGWYLAARGTGQLRGEPKP